MLLVNHILGRSGRSWIVMVLTDGRKNALWEGKAREYPWPIPSPLGRLLRSMAKSTCQDTHALEAGKAPTQAGRDALAPSQIPKDALAQHNN